MSAASLRRRPFGKWLRSLIADMVMTGQMPLHKIARTARILDILETKAQSNPSRRFTAHEFDSFTRVISDPSRDIDLEAEIAWSLFDLDQSGHIADEDAEQLRALWAKLGREGGEDVSFTTLQEYDSWYSSSVSQMRSVRTPPRAGTAPSTSSMESQMDSLSLNLGPARMVFQSQRRPQDHLLRSAEASKMCLQEVSTSGQAFGIRSMTPSRPSKPKRPPRSPASIEEQSSPSRPSTTPRLPAAVAKVHKPLDWEAQNEWWLRKDNRLRPFMEVTASYLRSDGTKVQGAGVLLNGWGVANKAARIPHSSAPDGARFGDYRKGLGCGSANTSLNSEDRLAIKAQIALEALLLDEGAAATTSPESWGKEVEKWKDVENNVVVLIHGYERLIPREWVRPVLKPRSPSRRIAK